MCWSCAQLRFDKGDTIELISSTRTNALLEGDPYLHGQLIISPKNETWLNKLGECFSCRPIWHWISRLAVTQSCSHSS